MLENWCYEKEVLKRMSSHFKTQEPLPDHIIDKLVHAKRANSGSFSSALFSGYFLTSLWAGLINRRQIFFGMFDILLHTKSQQRQLPHYSDSGWVNTAKMWEELRKEITWIQQPPGTNPAASFGHLMGG